MKLKIVLSGGIASGKSSVCKMLSKRGFIIIDSDKIAHNALSKNVKLIEKTFGSEYINGGEVDRKKLGSLVFNNKQKRKILENMLHEDIFEGIQKEIERAEKNKKTYIVEMPLFFEREEFYEAELKVVVYATKEQQLERLIKRSGTEEKKAKAMIKSQLDIETKKAKADFVINNLLGILDLQAEVDRFIKFLKEKDAIL